MTAPPTQVQRFVALDAHKRYVMVAAVDTQQNAVLPPRRLFFDEFEAWTRRNLKPTDAVVLEATTNAWHLYDQLVPLVTSVTVAHPLLVKLITAARVKTDPRDALSLARLLAAGLVPSVWVPPQEVRELRGLVAHRRRLVNQRSQARNRLHSVLHRHNLLPPPGEMFAVSQRAWWEGLDLPASEKLRIRQDLAILDGLEPLIAEVEAELAHLSTVEPWASQVPFLVQLPGIGALSAMILLSAIGDISRFPSAKKLVGYSGLGASVHDSGQTHRTGGITKQSRKEIRSTMVEAAWVAVGTSPYWKARLERLARRLGHNKALVAIARKLLVVVWHVLSKQVADRHADPERVAFKLMDWSWKLGAENRGGQNTATFIRCGLNRLKMGESLKTISRSSRTFRLPSAETLVAAASNATG